MMNEKRRHGCLGTTLMLMILANSVIAFAYLMPTPDGRDRLPGIPEWAFRVLGLGAVLNVTSAVALWKWKKWGFFGFCLSCVVALVVNLQVGVGIINSVAGLLGALMLYGVLQIGGEKKGWTQLD